METKLGVDHPDTCGVRRSLGQCYILSRQFARAEPLLRKNLDLVRKRFGHHAPQTADEMASLASVLLPQSKFAEAEPLLRDCLAIRTARQPDHWSTFNARSLLGEALLGQGRYTEAEPLIVSGYEGMKARQATMSAPARTIRPAQAATRVVRLYEAWGRPDRAASWRAKLGADLPAGAAPDPDAGFPANPFAAP